MLLAETAASLRHHQQKCTDTVGTGSSAHLLRRWNAAIAATLIITSPVALPAFTAMLLVGLLPTSAYAQDSTLSAPTGLRGYESEQGNTFFEWDSVTVDGGGRGEVPTAPSGKANNRFK